MSPALISSAMVLNWSSRGTFGSIRCSCQRSMRSTRSRRRPSEHIAPFRDGQPIIGMKRLRDELFADERAIAVCRIDEVDGEFGQPSQDAEGLLSVFGFAPDARSGQSHGTEAKSVYDHFVAYRKISRSRCVQIQLILQARPAVISISYNCSYSSQLDGSILLVATAVIRN